MQKSNLPKQKQKQKKVLNWSKTGIKQKILILLYFKLGNWFACNTKKLFENKATGGKIKKIIPQKQFWATKRKFKVLHWSYLENEYHSISTLPWKYNIYL